MVGQKRTLLNGCSLHLYRDPITPAVTDTAATYTGHETTGTGYAPQPITSFGAAYLNASGQGQTDSGQFTFTPTGTAAPWTIYGFYILDPANALVGAWRDPAGPVVLNSPAQSYLVNISVLDSAM